MAAFTVKRASSFFIVPSISVPVGSELVTEKIRLKVKTKDIDEVMSLVAKGMGMNHVLLQEVIEGWDETGDLAPRDEAGSVVPPTPENIRAFCQSLAAVKAAGDLYIAALRGERLGN